MFLPVRELKSLWIVAFMLALGSGLHASAAQEPAVELRQWTDNTGGYRVSARLISDTDAGITLEKEDGSRIIVPYERLSSADQFYLNTQNQERGNMRIQQIVASELQQEGGKPWRRWAMFLLPLIIIISTLYVVVYAFRTSILWGFCVLFIPCVYYIFIFCNWRELGRHLIIQLLCFAGAFFLWTLEMPQTYQLVKDSWRHSLEQARQR